MRIEAAAAAAGALVRNQWAGKAGERTKAPVMGETKAPKRKKNLSHSFKIQSEKES